jgi:hypothetical protein
MVRIFLNICDTYLTFVLFSGMQEQLQVYSRQEEQDSLQGLQAEEVPDGWHVQVRVQVWPQIKLVQDPLHHAKECRQIWRKCRR